MKYNFDRPAPPRLGVEALKWDLMGSQHGPDIVPLSVADMELLSPPQIISALEELARSGMWGYTGWGDRYFNALHNWMAQRHGWNIQRDWLIRTSGVVQGVSAAVRALTRPGDGIVVQPPLYPPLIEAVCDNGRIPIENPLRLNNGHYEMDFADLEDKLARPEVTTMILCSPHNPVGRVWTRCELQRLGQLCLAHNVLVISDEIHSDLVHAGHRHTPYAALGDAFAQNCVTGTACSKTFSLAGLCCANMLVPDPGKKRALEHEIQRSGAYTHSAFGTLALEVGYEQCAPWLDELLPYIYNNYLYLKDFFAQHFPSVWVAPLEGTYLAWLDMGPLGLDDPALNQFLEEDAQLFLSHGQAFGAPCFQRVNLACARQVLAAALDRLLSAARKRGLA